MCNTKGFPLLNSSAFPADGLWQTAHLDSWALLLQDPATVIACAEIAGSVQHPEMLRGHQCVAGTPPHSNQAVWEPRGTDHRVRAEDSSLLREEKLTVFSGSRFSCRLHTWLAE